MSKFGMNLCLVLALSIIMLSLPPMGPNTLRMVRITTEPFSIAQKYRITVIVNHDHRIKEKKTDNNEKYKTFTVGK